MHQRKLFLAAFLLAGAFLLVSLPGRVVQAAPASPVEFTVTQPDGTTFRAVQWGDEDVNGLETPDGYSIEQDPANGYWYYLTLDADGILAPALDGSGVLIVGRDDPRGLKKHVRSLTASTLLASPAAPDTGDLVASPPASGNHKVAVFLVYFPTNAPYRTSAAYWQNLVFGGPGSGSLADYYNTVSDGAFTISPANETSGVADDGVIGWIDMTPYYPDGRHPNPGSYVTDANKYITKRALQLGDSYINFAPYDTDGNGMISSDELHIIVIVAGFERSYGGTFEPAVWAHNSDLSGTVGAPTLDGKVLANASRNGYYSQVGELYDDSFPVLNPTRMGLIAHEFGHDLGWPDLYDIDYSSNGVGDWSVMGTGLWNGLTYAADSPAYPDAFLRWYQGWITPTTISGYSYGQLIPQAESGLGAFLLRTNPDAVDWRYRANSGQGEYYLVENRQQTSFDSALPGCGLLVWHIDETVTYTNSANANENHPLVKLIEADGLYDLVTKANTGDDGDPYPGSTGNRWLTYSTLPNDRLYNGGDSFVRVTNVSDCGAVMSADLLYGYPVSTLSSITPGSSAPSSTGFTLTVLGKDFYPNSIVRWNGSDRTTYYDSSTQLRAVITNADMVALGGVGNSASVTVFTPQPGGGVSAARWFTIVDTTTITPQNFITMMFKNFIMGRGYITLMSTDFESTTPWTSWENLEFGTGDYKWGRRDCRAANGSYSGWAAGGGVDGSALPCGSNYPNSMDTYITWGPFSTENGVVSGEMKFRFWLNSEVGYDYLWVTANVGGTNEWGYKISGNSGGWIEGTLNLNDLDGLGHSVIVYPKVWVRFRFTSDGIGSTGEGAFVDDVVLRVCKSLFCSETYSPSFLSTVNGLPVSTGTLQYEPVFITTTP